MVWMRVKQMWRCWRRAADRPFASALAILSIAGSISALTHSNLVVDILQELVPHLLLTLLAVSYGLAGILLLWGITWNRTDIEGAGCALMFSGLLVRAVALVAVFGFEVAVLANVMFYLIFAGACVERFIQCFRGEHIVRVRTVISMDDLPQTVHSLLMERLHLHDGTKKVGES